MTVTAGEDVRLVIWDLDETLWEGTLTEGGIKNHFAANYQLIETLARRGIMSSICSKNDFEAVRQILVEQGVWEFFVFPSVDWSAKGERIQAIIDAMQLRPQSVVFIDDHPSNRAEAQSRIPGLRVVDETFINQLLENPMFVGKDDRELVRLSQYKNLEQKAAQRQQASNGADFLKSSDIRVVIEHDCLPHITRIVELLNRTNQLNFTKNRLSEDLETAKAELLLQLNATSGRRAGLVKVSDRFGDYGIVGFWMMDGIWVEPYLIHFVFSCRTMGMGVEQWVYDKLGRPKIDVVGEVVASLDSSPDWINQTATSTSQEQTASAWCRVRLRGGCELEVVKHFLSFEAPAVESEFVFPRNGQVIWSSHSVTLFPQKDASTELGLKSIGKLGFQCSDLSSEFLNNLDEQTCLIFSPSGDGHVTLYKHNRLDLVVPIKLFGIDVFNPEDHQFENYVRANKLAAEQEQALRCMCAELKENYTPLTFADFDFAKLYDKIANSIPSHCLLIILQPISFAPLPEGGTIHFEYQDALNAWMTEVAARYSNVKIVQTIECISSVDDLRKFSHLHFSRDVYHRIFQLITLAFQKWRPESTEDHLEGVSKSLSL